MGDSPYDTPTSTCPLKKKKHLYQETDSQTLSLEALAYEAMCQAPMPFSHLLLHAWITDLLIKLSVNPTFFSLIY